MSTFAQMYYNYIWVMLRASIQAKPLICMLHMHILSNSNIEKDLERDSRKKKKIVTEREREKVEVLGREKKSQRVCEKSF